MGGAIVLAQPLQDELVVHEALDGLEQEGVERQVADLLQLKLLVHRLQLLQPLGGLLQLRQHLVVLLQEAGELLGEQRPPSQRQAQKLVLHQVAGARGAPREVGHLERGHVPQHHVADPLVVAFDVSIRAPLPAETAPSALECGCDTLRPETPDSLNDLNRGQT